MVKRVRHALLVLLLLFGGAASAQQMYLMSQFMFNNYAINPAIVGTYNYYQFRYTSRLQWAGINDAPHSHTFSVYGPHPKLSMGFGGLLYLDFTGPTSRYGLYGTYAYNFPIADDIRLSLGLSLGTFIERFDATKFDLGDNTNALNDPALLRFQNKATAVPDGVLGVYIYASQFFVGLSAHQLFFIKRKFYDNPLVSNRLSPNLFLSASYLIYLREYFEIQPSVVLKYTYPSPFQFDVSVAIRYQSQFWAGISYRFGDAVSFLLGYKFKNKFMLGYSFDFSYTKVRLHSYGSHEILLGYQFEKLK